MKLAKNGAVALGESSAKISKYFNPYGPTATKEPEKPNASSVAGYLAEAQNVCPEFFIEFMSCAPVLRKTDVSDKTPAEHLAEARKLCPELFRPFT